MAKCDFLTYKGWSGGDYCLKKDDSVDKRTVDMYCDNSLRYRDCPIYNSTSGSSGCYLTTACVEHKGLPDDCVELSTLREFRDGYMSELEMGKEDIRKYYCTAPAIVKAINRRDNADEIYQQMYSDVIVSCVELIKAGKNEEAYEKYKGLVESLSKEYLR